MKLTVTRVLTQRNYSPYGDLDYDGRVGDRIGASSELKSTTTTTANQQQQQQQNEPWSSPEYLRRSPSDSTDPVLAKYVREFTDPSRIQKALNCSPHVPSLSRSPDYEECEACLISGSDEMRMSDCGLFKNDAVSSPKNANGGKIKVENAPRDFHDLSNVLRSMCRLAHVHNRVICCCVKSLDCWIDADMTKGEVGRDREGKKGGWLDSLKRCQRKLMSVMLVLRYDDSREINMDHANALIFDLRKKRIERFEPIKPPEYLREDEVLSAYFSRVLPGWRYVPIYPRLFPQTELEDSIRRRRENFHKDWKGTCGLWSIWYMDLRARFPDTSNPESLVDKVIASIAANKPAGTTDLGAFETFILSVYQRLLVS
jgi:hypothetical protein